MNTRTHRPLIALNLALAGVLGWVTFGPAADAQRAQPREQRRGEYAVLAANAQGVAGQSLVLVDAANGEMVAFAWNRSRNQFEPLGLANILEDSDRPSGGVTR